LAETFATTIWAVMVLLYISGSGWLDMNWPFLSDCKINAGPACHGCSFYVVDVVSARVAVDALW
jgi:hypothetical protein